MGSAQSTNVTNTVIGSYAKVLQSTTNSAFNSSINKININVAGGKGDVNIENVLSKQTVASDLSASFKTVNDSSVMQKVAQQLEQQATSLVSGLNLGNASESENSINSVINASMDVSQTISTTCAAIAANEYNLNVENRDGNVNIKNLNIEQTIQNNLKCAGDSLNKSVASQDISNKITQVASATTEGISLPFWIIGVIIGGIFVSFIVTAYVAKPLLPLLIASIIVMTIYWTVYKDAVDRKDQVQTQIDKNESIMRQSKYKKPMSSITCYHYTCGLHGIGGDYRSCFQRPYNYTATPAQNVMGCKFKEVAIDATFSSPDDAYEYWANDLNLVAVDMLSRGDGTYDYHFYSGVSDECKTLMDKISKDPSRTLIPPLVCIMLEPTTSLSSLPQSTPEYSLVFTTDGHVYYLKNKEWVAINSASIFSTTNPKNIFLSMTPLDVSTVKASTSLSGKFYFIDMSTARIFENEMKDKYYYTVYSYDLGDTTRPPGDDIELDITKFVKVGEIDTTNVVVKEKIGPYMTNPLMKLNHNMTYLWDPVDPISQDIGKRNQALLTKYEKQEKNGIIMMGVVSILGVVVTIIMAKYSATAVKMPKNPFTTGAVSTA